MKKKPIEPVYALTKAVITLHEISKNKLILKEKTKEEWAYFLADKEINEIDCITGMIDGYELIDWIREDRDTKNESGEYIWNEHQRMAMSCVIENVRMMIEDE